MKNLFKVLILAVFSCFVIRGMDKVKIKPGHLNKCNRHVHVCDPEIYIKSRILLNVSDGQCNLCWAQREKEHDASCSFFQQYPWEHGNGCRLQQQQKTRCKHNPDGPFARFLHSPSTSDDEESFSDCSDFDDYQDSYNSSSEHSQTRQRPGDSRKHKYKDVHQRRGGYASD